MTKTKIKKIVAGATIAALSAITLGTSYASNIGTVSVTGTGAFDGNVVWDDSLPGTATGTVAGIVVKAKVLPTLNMEISDTEIDLGTLIAGVASEGSLNIEVGTNAANGVTITARSSNSGLENTTDNTIKINDVDSDGEHYTFESVANLTDDSNATGYTSTGNFSEDDVNSTAENVIYSTNKPELSQNVDDVEFSVSATATSETPAGDYEDTITFTVTGNF